MLDTQLLWAFAIEPIQRGYPKNDLAKSQVRFVSSLSQRLKGFCSTRSLPRLNMYAQSFSIPLHCTQVTQAAHLAYRKPARELVGMRVHLLSLVYILAYWHRHTSTQTPTCGSHTDEYPAPRSFWYQ
jgi:hypothetical protein